MSAATPSTMEPVIATYRKRARHYDLTANLYYLAGFRERAYRVRAISQLGLHAGNTILEIGCGTGLNFGLLENAIGPDGRLIGIDAMLEQARNRTAEHGWRNVELVCTDAADYMPPPALDGALSTFALSLSPRADDVIVRTTRALRPGGRLVILDLKMPPPPLERFVPWLLPLVRPFAVDDQVLAMRPWERIWGAMFRHLDDVHIEEHYGGIAYLASGSAR